MRNSAHLAKVHETGLSCASFKVTAPKQTVMDAGGGSEKSHSLETQSETVLTTVLRNTHSNRVYRTLIQNIVMIMLFPRR